MSAGSVGARPSGRVRGPAPGARGEAAAPRPRLRLSSRAAVLAVLLTVVAVFAVAPARAYLDQRATIARLERRAQALTRANARLQAEIERLKDPSVIERLARECLGMVRPGEIAFVAVPRRGDPPPVRC
ncbi:MAG TPA: septum formation initiator family protein [Actinomycetota bacterium]|nr:septum formation initiator family protein [Actinomycetota bacterium]